MDRSSASLQMESLAPPTISSQANIGTNYSILNGTNLNSSYFYQANSTSSSTNISSINGVENATYSGTAGNFVPTSISGNIVTLPNGMISIGGTSYQVYGASNDGRTLFFGTQSNTQSPVFALTMTGSAPTTAISYRSTNAYTSPPCFLKGTMILTDHGERAVETLRVGDKAVVASGEMRNIVWVGSRTIQTSQWPHPIEVMPVQIRRNAVRHSVPNADLFLSPGHRVLLDGNLFCAIDLVNGASIVQHTTDAVTYFHVELESHDALIANGLEAESYLDVGNRSSFQEEVITALRPSLDLESGEGCFAPFVKSGPLLENARARISERTASSGWEFYRDGKVILMANDRIIEPFAATDDRRWFLISGDADEVRIMSNATVLSTFDRSCGDTRKLGLCIHDVRIDGQSLGLRSSAYGNGFHDIEGDMDKDWRWTDGDAHLAIPRASRVLEVSILQYPLDIRRVNNEMRAVA